MSNSKYNADKENTIFVRKLRKLFDETGKTQQELIDFIQEKSGDAPKRQTVSAWLHGNKPDIETIPIIAEFFDVSTDYLLTKTDVKPLNLELKAISDLMGVSSKAAENLQKAASGYWKPLNSVLENDTFWRFLEIMETYKFSLKKGDNFGQYINKMIGAAAKTLLPEPNAEDIAVFNKEYFRNICSYYVWQIMEDYKSEDEE